MSRSTDPYFSNPFAETTEDPFRDPAVSAARESNAKYTLEDESPPLESVQLNSAADSDTTRQISDRERELSQREAQLAARERALQQQAEELRLQGGKPPNFPPFYPIYYMDIEVEIPEASRKIVRLLFQSWFAFIAVGVINFVASILILAAKPEGLNTAGQTFGGALTYMLVMPIPSFFFWYRPVYNAFMKERAFFYFGVPGSGSCGLINSIIVLAAGKTLATVFGFITVGLWAALAVINAFLFLRVHRHCQEVGHSFSDAKSEALTRASRSGVAREAAGSYARQQFSA